MSTHTRSFLLHRRAALVVLAGVLALGAPGAAVGQTHAEDTAQTVDLDALIRDRDYEALRELGPSVVSELVGRYRVSDEDERARIARLLYRLGVPSREAKEALMEDVRSQHRDLRINAQYALGRVSNDEDVVDALFENMRHGETWLFRDKAACSLAYDQIHLTEGQRLRLMARLIEALGDQDGLQRDLAIRVLEVQTGQRRGFDALAPPDQRRQAIEDWWRWWHVYKSSVAELESPD